MAFADDPERVAQLVAFKAAGLSDNQTGKQMGVAHSTVGRLTRREDIRAAIEETHRRLLEENLDNARANITNIIAGFTKYEEDRDASLVSLALKYSAEILRSIGALPAVAPAVMVTNIYNEQVVLSPVVAQIIQEFSAKLTAPDEIDN